MGEVISHYKAINGGEGFGDWETDQVDSQLNSTELNLTEFC